MVREGAYGLIGRMLVTTGRTGLGARAGHDLVIEALSWRGSVTVGAGGVGSSSVSVEVDTGLLEVRAASGGLKPMSDGDRRDIQKNMAKILQPQKWPTLSFQADEVAGGPDALELRGTLTLLGQARPLVVAGSVDADGRVAARAVVTQSKWGVKPFSAMFGAIKLADDVGVQFEGLLTSPEGSPPA